MSGYLQSLLARARGAPPAIRPVVQLRFPVRVAPEQPVMTAPSTRRSDVPRPPHARSVRQRDAPDAALAVPEQRPVIAPDVSEAVDTIAHAQAVIPAAAANPPVIAPRLPVQPEDASHNPAESSRVDVQKFVAWLDSEPVPQDVASLREAIPISERAARTQTSRIDMRAESTAPAVQPDTHIHIGRVELISMAPPPRAGKSTSRPALSLDEYLRRRDGKA